MRNQLRLLPNETSPEAATSGSAPVVRPRRRRHEGPSRRRRSDRHPHAAGRPGGSRRGPPGAPRRHDRSRAPPRRLSPLGIVSRPLSVDAAGTVGAESPDSVTGRVRATDPRRPRGRQLPRPRVGRAPARHRSERRGDRGLRRPRRAPRRGRRRPARRRDHRHPDATDGNRRRDPGRRRRCARPIPGSVSSSCRSSSSPATRSPSSSTDRVDARTS